MKDSSFLNKNCNWKSNIKLLLDTITHKVSQIGWPFLILVCQLRLATGNYVSQLAFVRLLTTVSGLPCCARARARARIAHARARVRWVSVLLYWISLIYLSRVKFPPRTPSKQLTSFVRFAVIKEK